MDPLGESRSRRGGDGVSKIVESRLLGFLHSAYHQECHSYDYHHCSYYQSIENAGVNVCLHRATLY